MLFVKKAKFPPFLAFERATWGGEGFFDAKFNGNSKSSKSMFQMPACPLPIPLDMDLNRFASQKYNETAAVTTRFAAAGKRSPSTVSSPTWDIR